MTKPTLFFRPLRIWSRALATLLLIAPRKILSTQEIPVWKVYGVSTGLCDVIPHVLLCILVMSVPTTLAFIYCIIICGLICHVLWMAVLVIICLVISCILSNANIICRFLLARPLVYGCPGHHLSRHLV